MHYLSPKLSFVAFALVACLAAVSPFARAATEVVAAGYPDYGATVVPAGLTNATVVAVGTAHSLALRSDGTVLGWGSNTSGQITVPTGVGAFTAIAAAGDHSVGVTTDGTVHVWGQNATITLAPPAGLTGVAAVATSDGVILARKSDGTVATWGDNSSEQTLLPKNLGGVVAVAINSTNSFALKSDGTVVVWGNPSASVVTNLPAGLSGVTAISVGADHALALKLDGTVVAWGRDWSGQATVPAGLTGVVAISASEDYSVAVKSDGSAVAWGSAFWGQLELATGLLDGVNFCAGPNHALALRSRDNDTVPSFTLQPVAVFTNEDAIAQFTTAASAHPAPTFRWQHRRNDVAAWSDLTDAQGYSGTTTATLSVATTFEMQGEQFRCVAANAAGATNSAEVSLTLQTRPLITPTVSQRLLVSSGASFILSATATGTGTLTYQWKRNGQPIAGATTASFTDASFAPLGDAGYYQLLATDSVGKRSCTFFVLTAPAATSGLRTWGDPVFATFPSDSAALVGIATPFNRAVGLRADGTVEVWGVTYPINQPPPGLTNVVAVDGGEYHTIALRADGTVVTWGVDSYAGSAIAADLRDVVAIAAGGLHNLALKADGTVVAWGDTSNGATTIPPGLANVVGIAAGDFHSVAVRADGTVACWGSNFAGQSTVPSGLANVKAVAAGYGHTLALKNDGTVVGWGQNATPPNGLANVAAIAAGERHSLALRANGTVACWGETTYGQSTPPFGLADVVALAGSNQASLAITFSPTTLPAIVSQPSPSTGTTGEGKPIVFSVTASGSPAPSYQWQRKQAGWYFWAALADGADFSGVTSASLNVVSPTTVMTNDQFRCVVANNQGSVTSGTATLKVTGTFATFQRLNFTVAERANPTVAGTAADPDGDGMNNLLEYAVARNPNLADASGAVSLSIENGYATLGCDRPKDASDLTYYVDASDGLATWTDITGSLVLVSFTSASSTADHLVVRESTLAAGRRFFRLRVEKSP